MLCTCLPVGAFGYLGQTYSAIHIALRWSADIKASAFYRFAGAEGRTLDGRGDPAPTGKPIDFQYLDSGDMWVSRYESRPTSYLPVFGWSGRSGKMPDCWQNSRNLRVVNPDWKNIFLIFLKCPCLSISEFVFCPQLPGIVFRQEHDTVVRLVLVNR